MSNILPTTHMATIFDSNEHRAVNVNRSRGDRHISISFQAEEKIYRDLMEVGREMGKHKNVRKSLREKERVIYAVVG